MKTSNFIQSTPSHYKPFQMHKGNFTKFCIAGLVFSGSITAAYSQKNSP